MDNKKFDQIKYQNQYNKEKYDKILLMVPKGEKNRIRQRAKTLNESVNKYIYNLIEADMNNINHQ